MKTNNLLEKKSIIYKEIQKAMKAKIKDRTKRNPNFFQTNIFVLIPSVVVFMIHQFL